MMRAIIIIIFMFNSGFIFNKPPRYYAKKVGFTFSGKIFVWDRIHDTRILADKILKLNMQDLQIEIKKRKLDLVVIKNWTAYETRITIGDAVGYSYLVTWNMIGYKLPSPRAIAGGAYEGIPYLCPYG